MAIFKLKPTFKDYIWGGETLKKEYGKESELEIVAESWELSCHQDGMSVINSGKYKGMALAEYIEKHGVIGENAKEFEYFPILIKLIDAKNDLSIQVHPSDEYALKNENQYGKTEVWYILDCQPDAFIYYSFKEEVTETEFREAIENGTVCDILKQVKVKKGDVFFIESGTIHAIGKGIVIAEIQQNSNVTYRVFDYGRLDANGNGRELHVEKAVAVTNRVKAGTVNGFGDHLVTCKYFTVDKLDIDDRAEFQLTDKTFYSPLCTDGEVEIKLLDEIITLKKGESAYIDACNETCIITGSGSLLISYV